MNKIQTIKEIFPQVKEEKIIEQVWEAEARLEAFRLRMDGVKYTSYDSHSCYSGYEGL